jgi:hypothetical protein
MKLKVLGSLKMTSTNWGGWSGFAKRVLGLQAVRGINNSAAETIARHLAIDVRSELSKSKAYIFPYSFLDNILDHIIFAAVNFEV